MNIMKELYNGNISGINLSTSKEYRKAEEKEIELCKELESKIPNECIELLEEYITAFQNANTILEEERYIQGFKIGLLLGIEAKNIEL